MSTTIDIVPGAAGDNCRDYLNGSEFSTSLLVWGNGGSPGPIDCYMRFPNITITRGNIINNVVLRLQSYSGAISNTVNAKIYSNAIDNSIAPTNHTEFAALGLSTNYISWDSIPSVAGGSNYNVPDLTTIVQEIIDRAGWSSGNALGILIKNNASSSGANRDAKVYGWGALAVPQLTITYTDYFNRIITESFTLSESEISWYNPERITENITFDDITIGPRIIEVDNILEDLTFSEMVKTYWDLDITENLTLSETPEGIRCAVMIFNEALTFSEDVLCPMFFESLIEAMNLDDTTIVENKNVTWREERSISMVGQHLQLKLQNNTLEQGLYLRDLKMYFDRWEDRKAIEAGDYIGEHVRFKIQNNVVDEGLYLEYIRIIGIFRGLLGWQV